MRIISIMKVASFVLIVASLCIIGCVRHRANFHELKYANRTYKNKADFVKDLPVVPTRITVDQKGVETWAWDCDVLRQKRMDKTQGDKYWYGGYYADCTFEVDFDQQGKRIGSRWVGSGCFNSRGELYEEGSFFYDE